MTGVLDIANVTKRFRGLVALSDVSISVPEGSIFAVIGPNGAGKTTLFNVIAGVYAPDAGTVSLAGARLHGLGPDRICRMGVARTFQIVRPFPQLSVADNVLIGALLRTGNVTTARSEAGDVMRRLDLWDKRDRMAAALTLPDRKRLEVARALATRPRVLLLDEVMAGLRPSETDQAVATLRDVNRRDGVTIVLIEHVMRAVMALAQRVHVLNHGASLAEGAPEDIVRDPRVIESYLGAGIDA